MEPDDAPSGDVHSQVPEHVIFNVSCWLVKPALHVQSKKASLPAGEEDPAKMPSRQLAVRTASYFEQARPSCIHVLVGACY